MSKMQQFADTFAALRSILEPYAKRMAVTVDEPGHYQLASPTMTDRVGRPLFCASVQVNKNYVSYHLMPVYVNKALLDRLSPSLRKRMQGKSCFNFTTVEPEQLKELAAVTKKGIAGFKNLRLPFDAGQPLHRLFGRGFLACKCHLAGERDPARVRRCVNRRRFCRHPKGRPVVGCFPHSCEKCPDFHPGGRVRAAIGGSQSFGTTVAEGPPIAYTISHGS